jgi:hypothetical protein
MELLAEWCNVTHTSPHACSRVFLTAGLLAVFLVVRGRAIGGGESRLERIDIVTSIPTRRKKEI